MLNLPSRQGWSCPCSGRQGSLLWLAGTLYRDSVPVIVHGNAVRNFLEAWGIQRRKITWRGWRLWHKRFINRVSWDQYGLRFPTSYSFHPLSSTRVLTVKEVTLWLHWNSTLQKRKRRGANSLTGTGSPIRLKQSTIICIWYNKSTTTPSPTLLPMEFKGKESSHYRTICNIKSKHQARELKQIQDHNNVFLVNQGASAVQPCQHRPQPWTMQRSIVATRPKI